MTTVSNKLPVFQTIQISWEKVKGSKLQFWAAFSIYILCELFEAGLIYILYLDKTIQPIDFFIINTWTIAQLLQVILILQCLHLGLQHAANKPISFNISLQYIFDVKLLCKIMCLSLLIGFFALVPTTILFLIPTIVDAFSILHGIPLIIFTISCYILGVTSFVLTIIRSLLSYAVCIAQKTGPIESLVISFQATQSNVLRLLCMSAINAMIFFISAFPFGIGFIWTFPYFFINYGMIYKILINPASEVLLEITPVHEYIKSLTRSSDVKEAVN